MEKPATERYKQGSPSSGKKTCLKKKQPQTVLCILSKYQHVHWYVNKRGVWQDIRQADNGVPMWGWKGGAEWAVFFLLCPGFPFSENVVFSVLFLQLKFRKSGHLTCSFLTLMCPVGEGNGNPLQCSCLENPRDGGAWWAAVYGVAQSQTRLK